MVRQCHGDRRRRRSVGWWVGGVTVTVCRVTPGQPVPLERDRDRLGEVTLSVVSVAVKVTGSASLSFASNSAVPVLSVTPGSVSHRPRWDGTARCRRAA